MRPLIASLLVLSVALPAAAQNKSYEIHTPGRTFEIRKPRDVWQVPGEIQVPKGIQAVKSIAVSRCERRVSVVADALFDFDKSNLRAEAEETLLAAAPEIKKLGKPSRIEGHTDSKGSDSYNMRLSEARATTVRDWMVKRDIVPATTPIRGFGKTQPVAPNATADGKDDPKGRQRNRRVEVVFDTCSRP